MNEWWLDILFSLVGLLVTVALASAIILLLIYLFIRIKRKGYKPPAAALVIALGAVLGVTGGVGVLFAFAPPDGIPNTNANGWVFAMIDLPIIGVALVTAFIYPVLPRRQLRTFGRRQAKFPFRFAGLLTFILGGIGLIAGFCFADFADWDQYLRLIELFIVAVVPVALGFFFAAGRTKAPELTTVLATDTRPPVLYLRAFNQESTWFVTGPYGRYKDYVTGFVALLAASSRDGDSSPVGVTFEQLLGRELNRSVGPFVALGSPEDYLPPDGAVRMYAQDLDWQDHFKDLAARASTVVVEVAKSENLRWEFQYLREHGLQRKLYVFTRPIEGGTSSKTTRLFMRFLAWAKGVEPVNWLEFAATLNRLGYRLDLSDPGNGAVVSFDEEGRSVVLTSGAELPEDYLRPMRERVAIQSHNGPAAVESPASTTTVQPASAPAVTLHPSASSM